MTPLKVTSLTLVNVRTRKDISKITSGQTVVNNPTLDPLSIRADVTGDCKSVLFKVDGTLVRTENKIPWFIGGDGGDGIPNAYPLLAGEHTIAAYPFAGANGTGTMGGGWSVTFTMITHTATDAPTPTPAPIPPVTPTPTSLPAPTPTLGPSPVINAVDYIIDSIWPVALKGLKGSRIILGVERILPLPSNTFTGDIRATLVKPAKFVPISGTPEQPVIYSKLDLGAVSFKNMHDIIIRNCRINGGYDGKTIDPKTKKKVGAPYGINCSGAKNILIEYCEISNIASAAIFGTGFIARYNLVHRSGGDAFKPEGNCIIEYNYVTYLGFMSPNAHADFVQSVDDIHGVIVRFNFFDGDINTYPIPLKGNCKANADWQLQGNNNNDNCQFTGNWCRGSESGVHMFNFTHNRENTIVIGDNLLIGTGLHYGNGAIVYRNTDLALNPVN